LTDTCRTNKEVSFHIIKFQALDNGSSTFNWQPQEIIKKETLVIEKYYETFPSRFFKEFKILDHNNFKLPSFKLWQDNFGSPTYAQAYGSCLPDIPYCSDPKSKVNLICGFLKRLSPLMPVPKIELVKQLGMFVNSYLQQNFVSLPFLEDKYEELVQNWLDENKHYSSSRKKALLLCSQTIMEHSEFKPKLTSKDYLLKSFIKREFYPEPKCPRFINSRSDNFKAYVGPFISLIEKLIYKLDYFVKGQDIRELPKKIIKLQKYKWILETDYTSFESGFNPLYVDNVECNLWRYMLKNNPNVLDAVMKCYYTKDAGKIVPRTDVLRNNNYEAKVVGSRMSGEMWTSLGNGFSNLMNMLFLSKIHNEPLEGFVEGDDGIFGMNNCIATPDYFEKLGFKIKMSYGQDIQHTAFCGNIFDVHDLLFLVPPEQINRTFWCCDPKYFNARPKVLESLLRCKAQSLYCQGKNTPIAGILAYKILTLLGSGDIRYEPWTQWWEMQINEVFNREEFVYVEPTMNARLLYSERFGINIDLQLDIENIIKNAQSIFELNFDIPLTTSVMFKYLKF